MSYSPAEVKPPPPLPHHPVGAQGYQRFPLSTACSRSGSYLTLVLQTPQWGTVDAGINPLPLVVGAKGYQRLPLSKACSRSDFFNIYFI